MDYGSLVGDAWRLTWRHRFLWLLGLFGGGASSFSLGNSGGGDFGSLFGEGGEGGAARAGATLADAARWLGDHFWIVVLAALLLVLLSLALFVASFIAQGGLSAATVELGTGRPSGLRHAVRTGMRLFWRNVVLWLILVAAVVVVGLVIAAFVGAAVLLTMAAEQQAWVIIPSVLLGLLLLAVLAVCGAVAGVVVTFAQRAIALLDIGPLAALRDGWQVARTRPGTVFLVWLLSLALSVGTGIATTVLLIGLLLVLGLPVLIAWFASGADARSMLYPAVAYGAVAVGVWFGGLLFLSAVVNTFHWSYWTLAYVRLRAIADRAPIPIAPD